MTEREGRGRAQVRDPAQAIAMGKCWLATWVRRVEAGGSSPLDLPAADSFHPGECAFCEMPRDLIIGMLEEFQAWSQISSYDGETSLRLEIEQWETIGAAEQVNRVRRAQGFNAPNRGIEPEDRRSPW